MAIKRMTELRSALVSKDVTLNDLMKYESEFRVCFDNMDSLTDNEIEAMLYICLDMYTYDEEGRVLLTDTQYDILMNEYISRGYDRIIYPDALNIGATWELKKHEEPATVGSLAKVYTTEEMISWLVGLRPSEFYRGMPTRHRDYIIAPKFDGVSASIKVKNRKIEYGLTRRDGSYGQDITECIKKMSNASTFIDTFEENYHQLYGGEDIDCEDGFFKVELVVTTVLFNQLIEEKQYSNRRSATSGIINTPSNLQYAQYVFIVPLMYKAKGIEDRVFYAPPFANRIFTDDYNEVLDAIEEGMNTFRLPQFPIRVDGCVIYENNSERLNPDDFMDCGIAFKANTAQAPTDIQFGYMSIGRLGKATPMIRVYPVEVNETIVTDVSLGSYQKFLGRNLHENERVIVYSAGDVIPQAKPMDPPMYLANAKPLKMDLHCPHCGEELTKVGNEYACTNSECPRRASGLIANFVDKIGGMNISDGVISDLYDNGIIQNIPDLFLRAVDRLRARKLAGWDEVSISNLETELKRLMNTPIEVSRFVGAMGIKNISRNKCREVFKVLDLKFFMKAKKKEMIYELGGVDGFAAKTSTIFAEWMKENRDSLQELMTHFTIVPDKPYIGSVAFTGFRDEDLVDKFDALGYEVVYSIKSNTVACIAKDPLSNSGTCRSARQKGVTIVPIFGVDEVLDALRKKSLLNR